MDNYEDEGNNGQEFLVGDDNGHGKLAIIHRWQQAPNMLKKSGVSKPNIGHAILFGTFIMFQEATYELSVMHGLVTNLGIHGQISTSLMNNALSGNMGAMCNGVQGAIGGLPNFNMGQ